MAQTTANAYLAALLGQAGAPVQSAATMEYSVPGTAAPSGPRDGPGGTGLDGTGRGAFVRNADGSMSVGSWQLGANGKMVFQPLPQAQPAPEQPLPAEDPIYAATRNKLRAAQAARQAAATAKPASQPLAIMPIAQNPVT